MKINNKPVVRLSGIFLYLIVMKKIIIKKRIKKSFIKNERRKRKGKPESINEEQEKNEKEKTESDERQIFIQYDANDEYDLVELNKIAKNVLNRIYTKLSGTDFNPYIVYDVKSQVNKLIQQPT